jgi:hypothetical protein
MKSPKFYLGKRYDPASRDVVQTDALLLDSKDLLTHSMCIGMTGSGKTGLCISMLEEAAVAGIPAIIIDPKGDMVNLALSFPNMTIQDFSPWIDPAEAERNNRTVPQEAAHVALQWRKGLAEWNITPDRAKALHDAVDVRVYTPGSSAGIPISALSSFDVPPLSIKQDPDRYRHHVTTMVSGLLSLLDLDADPIQDPGHIFLSTLLQYWWCRGKNVSLDMIIRYLINPPFRMIGIINTDVFFPPKKRTALAMRLNGLLASPSFGGWREGEPLNVDRLLYSPQGKPQVSILSIAHLPQTERMFFVTLLLDHVLAWMQNQPGTSRLRALLYFDEIFGFMPPVANPPSKLALLTLLKQARAFGLGICLATQNPVDLDYRGLSNIGTWFVGRLQTDRDRMKILDGLEGASAQAGAEFNKREMDQLLSSLDKRVFLLHSVHHPNPRIFHSRWCLSYLRGPMTKEQIRMLNHQEVSQQNYELNSSFDTLPLAIIVD